MSGQNAPIIIKRKKVIAGGGHHGGAWKVAYADFVTAMMAFFMLMWLLNATTEQQRKGLADYFAPTIAISRTSAGGADVLDGDTLHQSDALSQSGTGSNMGLRGAVPPDRSPPRLRPGEGAAAAEVAALREIEEMLLGRGGESLVARKALRHVVTKLTDEGLVIEIFARPGAPIFPPGDTVPLPVTRALLGLVAQTAALVDNPVAVSAHLAARPVVLADNPVWRLSSGRAEAARDALEAAGLAPSRMRRVTGLGDRSPAADGPAAPRSDRLEITLLRRH
ncbi:flagellar motor protein MotB [Limimaricola cinnabarinus]|uniref:flagellar motor protein MotB n=1 Tax=Limimaricola cinnabarinus TaxID=1125964 RepID=UPI002490A88A|nr:flagellar motor protein MotB [Limimaricola cinnabarinus]